DGDVPLYFRYGHEFAAGHYPRMEYPQGALLVFAGVYLASSGDAERFAAVFPLVMLLCDLVTLASLVGVGREWRVARLASILATFLAVSPFTLVLWFGKFDALPAALLALGTYLFVMRRYSLTALALAAGFLAKWIPGIAGAFFAVYLIRAEGWRLGF